MTLTPTVATIYTGGLNSQLVHQHFDHRCMEHIQRMKKENMMNGLPSQITKFHDNIIVLFVYSPNLQKLNEIRPYHQN